MYSHLVIEEAGPLIHSGHDETLHHAELQYNIIAYQCTVILL